MSTLCADSYSVSVPPPPPRVTGVAHKRPRSFCQKCRWQVTPKHAYTTDPAKSEWADYAAVRAESGSLSGNDLTRNSSGNTRSQSSQLAEPLWTDPGVKSGISVRGLISTLFFILLFFLKRRRGMNCRIFSQDPSTRGKSHHHHPLFAVTGFDITAVLVSSVIQLY